MALRLHLTLCIIRLESRRYHEFSNTTRNSFWADRLGLLGIIVCAKLMAVEIASLSPCLTGDS